MTPLELIQVTARQHGYYDVDIEPTGVGQGVSITASKEGHSPITIRGNTLSEACDKFCARLLT